ncbi:MAG: cob(I)yrinic acid a,c-diamide adenosyltransferase [Bacteroidaceae bacterium]|nr:cob(I)yrinic acid a,c-diamide adenosyltransferase [Bacteroidaceae bacterium]
MKVYTRTGDTGNTSLIGGKRVSKTCQRIESYGTIDELNSQVGLLLTYTTDNTDRNNLISIQNCLFVIGALLATDSDSPKSPSASITADDIATLEKNIDNASEDLPKWKGFTLPGGSRAAAIAHICRTICRRAERQILVLNKTEPVEGQIICYVNRLSDYFYVLALRLNFLEGKEEILWQK